MNRSEITSSLKRITSLVTPRWIAAFAIVSYCIAHMYGLNAPPNGHHQWRESDTAAITLNYYQEDMNFLHPRVNQRGDSEGITGIEFPLYNYSAALIYHVTGPSHAAHRALTILAAVMSLWMMFLIGRRMYDPWVGAIACFALAWSPLFSFYGFKIMPDIWMLTYLLTSCFAFLKWRDGGSMWWLAASSLALLLSATVKPLGLAALFPFAYFAHRDKNRRSFILASIAAIFVVALTFAWYQYGRSVNAVYNSPGFDLGDSLGHFHQQLFKAAFFEKLFLRWPWELWIGWALAPLCIAGFFVASRLKDWALWLWVGGTYLAFAVTSSHSSTHDYYTLPILAPICLFAGLGGRYLWTRYTFLPPLVVVIGLAAPFVTVMKISHLISEVPEFETIRREADAIVPREALVVVQERTTAIRLYQLNRHGFIIRKAQSIAAAADGLHRGAAFLITERSYDNIEDSLPAFHFHSPQRIGSLYCYELIADSLKEPQENRVN